MPAHAHQSTRGKTLQQELSEAPELELLQRMGNQAAVAAMGPPDEPGDALSAMAGATGGRQLPPTLLAQLESGLGADLSGMRIHTGPEAADHTAAVDGGAVTVGRNAFFAPGRFDPSSASSRELIFEEAAHYAQTGGRAANPASMSLGSATAPAEGEAKGAARAIASGGTASVSSGHSPNVARRGEAGVHKSIGKKGAGKDADQKKVMQMYSGNFMRDFSQLRVPLIHNALKTVPRNLTGKELATLAAKGAGGLLNMVAGPDKACQKDTPPNLNEPVIGAQGATTLSLAVVQAIGCISLGKDVASTMVTPDSLGQYQPEEHLDNPMGMGASELLVKSHHNPNAYRQPGDRATSGGNRVGKDNSRDRQLQGSAGIGNSPAMQGAVIDKGQVENPALYKVSGEGLQNHIYNSTEWTKGEVLQASYLAEWPDKHPIARRHLGSGMHVVEDYFAHSNFIEVALNQFIESVLKNQKAHDASVSGFARTVAGDTGMQDTKRRTGGYVDTLWGAKDPSNSRQAITTGTFGGDDTKVSILHMILPHADRLVKSVDQSVQKLFDAALRDPDANKKSFGDLKKKFASNEMAAMFTVLGGMNGAGMQLPGLSGWTAKVIPQTNQMPASQAVVAWYKGVAAQARALKKTWFYKTFLAAIRKMQKKLVAALQAAIGAVIQATLGKDLFHKGMLKGSGSIAERSQKSVRALERSSSLDSRTRKGGDMRLSGWKECKDGRKVGTGISAYAMNVRTGTADPKKLAKTAPPSHSELAKDHPAHKGHKGHAHSGSSPFYGLHRALALQADKHILTQMQKVFSVRTQSSKPADKRLFGGKADYAATGLDNRHDQVTAAASQLADKRGAAAKKKGWNNVQQGRFAPKLPKAAGTMQGGHTGGVCRSKEDHLKTVAQVPEVKSALDLVDYFVSHPKDTNWWKPTMEKYIRGHSHEVLDHIRARNKTRSQRIAPADQKKAAVRHVCSNKK